MSLSKILNINKKKFHRKNCCKLCETSKQNVWNIKAKNLFIFCLYGSNCVKFFFWFKSFIVKLPTILFQRYVTDKMEPDKVEKVQGQVDELKGIMVKNIGK